jgi:hypothetical protein
VPAGPDVGLRESDPAGTHAHARDTVAVSAATTPIPTSKMRLRIRTTPPVTLMEALLASLAPARGSVNAGAGRRAWAPMALAAKLATWNGVPRTPTGWQ